jgi:hypothetical protein
MTIKKIKRINFRKSRDALDIHSVVKSVTQYKRGALKTISHSEIKTLLQLT